MPPVLLTVVRGCYRSLRAARKLAFFPIWSWYAPCIFLGRHTVPNESRYDNHPQVVDGNSLGLPHWWLAYFLAPNHLQIWSIAAAFCERPRSIVTCSQQTWWEASGAPGFAMAWGAGCVSQVVWGGTTQLIPLMNSRGLFLETSTWICFTDTLGTSAAMTYVHCQTSHVVNRSVSTAQLTQLDRMINWWYVFFQSHRLWSAYCKLSIYIADVISILKFALISQQLPFGNQTSSLSWHGATSKTSKSWMIFKFTSLFDYPLVNKHRPWK